MRRVLRIGLAGGAILLLALLILPLVIPIPPLEGTRPAHELAEPDSQFIEINGLRVHVKTAGQGEPVFLLLHGFGSNVYSWQDVMEPLGELGTVIAFDRPAFGLTERPLEWEGPNPYALEAQLALITGLLDHFQIGEAILVGNSAGGTVAMQMALGHPQRVTALILVDPAVYSGGGAPALLRPLLATPQMRRLGPLFARQILNRGPELLELAWHDTSKISAERVALYTKVLQVENWDKGLWEFTIASRESNLAERLDEIRLPVLVITGDDDRIVPTEESIRLAGELPDADLVVLENTGHLPQEESPELFMDAVRRFITEKTFGPIGED